MKLCGSTKSKIAKNENGYNLLDLKITEVVLVHCNIANNDYQQDSRVLYNDGTKNVNIMLPLKYLSDFCRNLEMSLINWEINLILFYLMLQVKKQN